MSYQVIDFTGDVLGTFKTKTEADAKRGAMAYFRTESLDKEAFMQMFNEMKTIKLTKSKKTDTIKE